LPSRSVGWQWPLCHVPSYRLCPRVRFASLALRCAGQVELEPYRIDQDDDG
jgi:hypothetical protein